MRPLFRRKPAPPLPTHDAQKNLERPSAQEIYEQVADNAARSLTNGSPPTP